jgi:hypothetical protein
MILVPDDRVWEAQDRIKIGESLDQHRTIRRHKDGASVHISLSVSPIRDDQGASWRRR